MSLYVLRYHEIALKGANRDWFEKRLAANVKAQLKPLGPVETKRVRGRILVQSDGPSAQVEQILSWIPGLANFSLVLETDHQMASLAELATKLVNQSLAKNPNAQTFRVCASRADKRFPLSSQQLGAELGGVVLEGQPQLKVKMKGADLELGVEIWAGEKAILYLEKLPGQGGLPVGGSGRFISFLSGGIDSPVASQMMMRRGAELVYLNFHAYPYIGQESKEKVLALVKHLSRYQPKSVLLVAPFAEIQKAIKANCRERLRTILYRRLMFQVANHIAPQYSVKGFITGEALGQVASQTIENLRCTEDAATLPVLRPLIGLEKDQIIERAQAIGSFEISIQPFPDCCTLFQPRRPETKGRIEELREEESRLDLPALLEECLAGLEKHQFYSPGADTFF
ncbi:MAG: tRNA 4-thiouridine(8) synthase ThiI [Candidatus Lambdaproteobacteria bacterium RIFOXYD12_FULL_49_8]|nr:MAG: tRNA 4-thiouridine(8) synthase ThiI [Candidatus Lambdaproteobacteria bacterium RIFOXYD12_FULL_49_8]